MPNNLGSGVAVTGTGMRTATGYEGGNVPPGHPRAQKPPKAGPPDPSELPVKLPPRPAAERLTPEQVAELFRDIEAGLARLDRAKTRGQDTNGLITQLRSEQFSVLTGEFIQLKRLETRKILEGMMRPERRRAAVLIDLNLFEAVANARVLATEIAIAKEEAFPSVARRIFEFLKAGWPKNEFPSPDPVCQAGESQS